jgi:hypothetical protein
LNRVDVKSPSAADFVSFLGLGVGDS